MIWTFIAAMLAGASLVMLFVPRLPASAAAYASLWALQLSPWGSLSDGTMIFWSVATAVDLASFALQDSALRRATPGVAFMRAGAMVGGFVGMAMNSMAAVIVSAAAGAVFGFLAFSRTRGAVPLMNMPVRRRVEYFAAKTIGAVIAVSMVCLTLSSLIVAA